MRLISAVLMISARVAAAAAMPVPDFMPPATNSVIGFDLRAIIDSGLIQSLGDEAFKNTGSKWTSDSPFPGVDPLKDLDDVVIASTLEGDRSVSLVVCRGRFPVDEISRGAERYRGIPIRPAKGGEAMALLDAGTVLSGDMKAVRAALDRRGTHAAGMDPALVRRAGELGAHYAIWGVGTVPRGYHPPSGSPGGFGSLDHFDFGIALGEGLEMAGTIHVRAAEDAQKLGAGLQLIEMMAKAQPGNSGVKIQTQVQNGTLSLSLSLTKEALKKAMEQQRAAILQAISQGSAKPASPGGSKPPTEVKIITDDKGNTLEVMLPGKP